MKYCEQCGKALNDGDVFCEACGHKVPIKSVPPTPQSIPPQVPTQVPTQAPPQANAFRDFSEQVNTGQVQKKTGSRGLLWGGIIALVFVTLLIMVVAVAIRKMGSKTEELVSHEVTETVFGDNEIISDIEASSGQPQNVKTDASLESIAGYWVGEFNFTRMDGLDSFPADELPANFEEMIARILSEPSAMEMEFEADGNWGLDIDVEMGMNFSSYDYDRNLYPTSPLIIKEITDGYFVVDHVEVQELDGDMARMRLSIDGYVVEDSAGQSINGHMILEMEQGDIYAFEEGDFILYPATE
jgi:DNA-directed RNA polymerase subunit RPC12/RpoP